MFNVFVDKDSKAKNAWKVVCFLRYSNVCAAEKLTWLCRKESQAKYNLTNQRIKICSPFTSRILKDVLFTELN